MFGNFLRSKKGRGGEILPDEVLLDATNLPGFDIEQFEGRVEHPVSRYSIIAIASLFVIVVGTFGFRAYDLQVSRGNLFAEASNNNRLSSEVVFALRGVIFDRNGTEIAWNEPSCTEGCSAEKEEYALRSYTKDIGLSHLLGFVRYPKTDKSGAWWRTEIVGVSGVESVFDDLLSGNNGKQIVEIDALGAPVRQQLIEEAEDGENITLAIDSDVQSFLHTQLAEHARRQGFLGGASVIIDVENGEVLALTSFPEFESQAMTDGESSKVSAYASDLGTPFLNRAISGVYTPGSIVKPIFAAAALAEKIISPDKSIYSAGFITIPNPYDPDKPTIIRDWRAHGWTDMREALSVSSDVYFFSIGGGYEDQRGLGIAVLDKYARMFGLGSETGIDLEGEVSGIIPTPEWKEQVFDGDDWRLGDTYNTSIGQYGFQITPVQAARFAAAIANGGKIVTPKILLDADTITASIKVEDKDLAVVREGMRLAVVGERGTAASLNVRGVSIAAKTGTAEVGNKKQWINSWAIGFWPAEDPKYAFATVLEKAPSGTLSGAAPAMRPFFEWLALNHPEYSN